MTVGRYGAWYGAALTLSGIASAGIAPGTTLFGIAPACIVWAKAATSDTSGILVRVVAANGVSRPRRKNH